MRKHTDSSDQSLNASAGAGSLSLPMRRASVSPKLSPPKPKKKYKNPFSEYAQQQSSSSTFIKNPSRDEVLQSQIETLRNRRYSGAVNVILEEERADLKIHAALRGHPVLDPLCKNPRGQELLEYQKLLDRQTEANSRNNKPQTLSERMQGVVLPGMGEQAKHARELILKLYPKKSPPKRDLHRKADVSNSIGTSPTATRNSTGFTRQAVSKRGLAKFVATRWKENGLDQMFRSIDSDNSGHVGLQEWIRGLQKVGCKEDAVLLFHWLDRDHRGLVSLPDLKTKLKGVVDAYVPCLDGASPTPKQVATLEKELAVLDDGSRVDDAPTFVGVDGLKTGLFARHSVLSEARGSLQVQHAPSMDEEGQSKEIKKNIDLFASKNDRPGARQSGVTFKDDASDKDSDPGQDKYRIRTQQEPDPLPTLKLEASANGQRLSRSASYYNLKHALEVRMRKPAQQPGNDTGAQEDAEGQESEEDESAAEDDGIFEKMAENNRRARGGTLIYSVSEARRLRAQLQDFVCGSTAQAWLGGLPGNGNKNPAAIFRKEFLRIHVYGYGTPYGEGEELYFRRPEDFSRMLRRCAKSAARPICGAPTTIFNMKLQRILSPDELEDGGEYILTTGDVPNCLPKVPEPIRHKLEEAVKEENQIQSDLIRILTAIRNDHDCTTYLAYLYGNDDAQHLELLDWFSALAELHLKFQSDPARLFEAVAERVTGFNVRSVSGSSLEQALNLAKTAKSIAASATGSAALKRGGSVPGGSSASTFAGAGGSSSQPQLRSVFEGATDIFKGASGLLADVQNSLDHNKSRFSELYTLQRKPVNKDARMKNAPGKSTDRSSGQTWHIPNLKESLKESMKDSMGE